MKAGVSREPAAQYWETWNEFSQQADVRIRWVTASQSDGAVVASTGKQRDASLPPNPNQTERALGAAVYLESTPWSVALRIA